MICNNLQEVLNTTTES